MNPTDQTGERIRGAGREAISEATQDVRSRIERSKSTAAGSAASTSEVLGHAAEDFSAHGQETLARATSMLAGKLSDLAGQLERRSLDDLSRDALEMARRNPGLFVAGGVALGLALSRFFKASTPAADWSPGTASSSAGAGLGQYDVGPLGEPVGDPVGEPSRETGGPAYGGEGAVPSQGSGLEGQESGGRHE